MEGRACCFNLCRRTSRGWENELLLGSEYLCSPREEKGSLALTVKIKKRYCPPRGPTGRKTMITAQMNVEHILHTRCAEGMNASMMGVKERAEHIVAQTKLKYGACHDPRISYCLTFGILVSSRSQIPDSIRVFEKSMIDTSENPQNKTTISALPSKLQYMSNPTTCPASLATSRGNCRKSSDVLHTPWLVPLPPSRSL